MLPSWRLIGGRGIAELIALAVAAISLIVVARSVGPSAVGDYALATSISQAGFILIGLGTAASAGRAVTTGHRGGSDTWWTVVAIRGVLGTGLTVAALAAIGWFGHDRLFSFGLAVIGAWLAYPFRSEWLLIATGEVMWAAWSRVISTLSMAVAAAVIATSPDPSGALPWLVAVPNIAYAAAGVLFALRVGLIAGAPAVARLRAEAPRLARASLGFVVGDLSTYIYSGLDRAILYVIASPAAAGLYDAAFKIIQPFYVVGTVATDAMYRPLAAMTAEPSRPTIRRYADLMLVATVPLGPFLAIFARPVIDLTYGPAFADAASILAVLGWVITAGYLSGILVLPTMAWGESSTYARSTGAGALVSLAGNIALIPVLAGVGTALTGVAAKVATGLVAYRTFQRVSQARLLPLVGPFVVASLIASAVGVAVRAATTSWVGAPAFAVVYLLVVLVARRPGTGATSFGDQTAVDSKTRVTG